MLEAAFYGDDFTGSTDAMAQFARAGLRTVLLVRLPSASELRELAERYDVIGVAGIARSLPPDEQEAEVRPVLEALRDLRPRVLQYKVCSTADSSPTRGSIGRALEIGREVCGPAVVPILIAQPELGRYTVFSHHFAAEAGTIHRLDRQPTMSTHPATPMDESDLRLHLSHQTTLPLTALHLTALHLTDHPTLPANLSAAGVVLDALTDDDLQLLGSVILGDAPTDEARFVIGSGGMSRAIASALRPAGGLLDSAPPTADGPVLVVSGSQSQRTAAQINHAQSAGWPVLPLTTNTPAGATADTATGAAERAVDGTVAGMAAGVVVRVVGEFAGGVGGFVVHTNEVGVGELGRVPVELAAVVRGVASVSGVRRVVVAGGDTSGQVLRELGVRALELAGGEAIAPGVHLCRVASAAAEINGLEVLLKPGQLGGVDLFTRFQKGSG